MNTKQYVTLAAGVIFAAATGTLLRAQTNVSNYVKRTTYTQTDTSQTKRQEVAWYDGLGHPVQTVRKGASQDSGDLVERTEYDSLGREFRVWQATNSSQTVNGLLAPATFKSAAQTAWSDTKPYSETVYDGTPLNRVRKVTGAGEAWHTADKAVRKEYLTGNPANSDYKVYCYTVSYSGDNIIIQRQRYGFAGEHTIERTLDEDGRETLEFKDLDGRTIQTMQVISGTSQLVTCYVYDTAGRLSGVLPPNLTAALTGGSGSSPSWNSQYLSAIVQYGYFYRYDARGRLIAKKLPGIGWTYYVYDKGDHLVLSQDPVQRNEGKWAFTLQDRLGRECVKGLCTNDVTPMSGALDDVNVTAVRDDAPCTLYSYHVDGLALENTEVLSVNWWDDYGFLGWNGIPAAQGDTTAYETPEAGYSARYAPSAHGQCTGTLSKVLDGASDATYLWTVIYYDDKGRPVQRKGSTHLGGTEKEYLGYDFVGQMKKRKVVHGNGSSTLTERYGYEYDNWGRPTTTTHKLNNGSEVTLVDCVYDALGRLVRDNRNGQAALDTRYTYNVRGWLTQLRVGHNSSGTLGTNYQQDLYYNVGRTNNSTTQWAGNISGMSWKAFGESTLHSYDFTYDGLSRLTGAVSAPTGGQTRYYSYDTHGNIQSVSGTGAPSSFIYTGNQLVTSMTGGTTVQHTYDANGRLSSDVGLWSYSYNAIGLPSARTNSSNETRWVYSADGTKLSRTTQIASAPRMDYVSNLVYKDSTLNRILVEGGYIDMTGSTPAYRFYVSDHQGNIRLLTDASGTALQVNHYDPFGNELDMNAPSSPIGDAPVLSGSDTVNPYKYSGKEWDSQASLYDFSARMYNPTLHRFTTMDPLAEKYYSISPYAYCAGNPVNLVDPSGCDWKDYIKGLVRGAITNIIPGPSNRRDISGLTSIEDYNAGLKTADIISFSVGSALIAGGESGQVAGTALVTTGGTTAATLIAAPEGATIAGAGAVVLAGSALTKTAGVVMFANTVHNSNSGYQHGTENASDNRAPKTTSQLQTEVTKGKAPKSIERFDKAHSSKGQDHVHFRDKTSVNQDGSAHDALRGEHNWTNKEKEFFKKNRWLKTVEQ